MNGYPQTVPYDSASARALTSGVRLDNGVTALILGAFAFMWFGWGQADASVSLGRLLTIGSGIAFAIAATGAVETIRNRHGHGAMHDKDTRRRYGNVVGVEVGVGLAGAVLLSLISAQAYVCVWICLVTGLHFLPLSRVLSSPSLRTLGVAVTGVGVLALAVGLVSNVAPGNVTGVGAGVALVAFSAVSLVAHGGRRAQRP